jgi:hypothetical protein
MASATSSRHSQLLHSIVENSNNINEEEISTSYSTDNYRRSFQWPTVNQLLTTTRTLSFNEGKTPISSHNNRLRRLCTRLKRRFTISKEYRPRTESSSICFRNYKSFSSSLDDSYNDFEWPDFEQIYDTIPPCLAKALPGLDDFSIDDDVENTTEIENFLLDETNEQLKLYEVCKRGKNFRRNAICRKLDKSQYKGQLNTFIQQLMIEKLMRTWT